MYEQFASRPSGVLNCVLKNNPEPVIGRSIPKVIPENPQKIFGIGETQIYGSPTPSRAALAAFSSAAGT